MSNELLDFTKQDNFEFFEFTKWALRTYGQERIEDFKTDCEDVLKTAHKTVMNMCELGARLCELKDSGLWREVENPETKTKFEYHSFEKFCAYAFGFSQTKTSDLMRISKFVEQDEKGFKFLEDKYSQYSTSQLVELAAVKDYNWKYFNPSMTVAEMRAVKKYIIEGDFYTKQYEKDFDIMQAMQAWNEKKAAEKEAKKAEDRPNVLPGQIELGEEVFEPEREEENPISDLATYVGEVEKFWNAQEYDKEKMVTQLREQGVSERTIEKIVEIAEEDEEDPYDMPMQTHSYDSDYSPDEEDDEETDYSREGINEIPDKVLLYEQGEYDPYTLMKGMFPGYEPNLKNRDGIREFYRKFRNWEQLYTGICFIQLYRYKFKSGTLYALSAPQTNILATTDERTEGETIHYFWQYKGDQRAFETNKLDLEKFIALHKDEL